MKNSKPYLVKHITMMKKWQSTDTAKYFKRRRIRKMDELMKGDLLRPGSRVIDIGCSIGHDYIHFAAPKGVWITGVDLLDQRFEYDNVEFIKANACDLPFEDNTFDIAISLGTFEHIQPIEALCKAIGEIQRVARSYCIMVPCIATLYEPHVGQFFWPVRSHSSKRHLHIGLNYFSDEAWLQFQGFEGASITRLYYIPLFIKNTIIYKNA